MSSGLRIAEIFLLSLSFALAAQQPQSPAKRGIGIAREGPKSGLGSARVPRGFAVIIASPQGRAHFADRDAQLLYDTLISSNSGNFAEQNVRKLIGPAATLDNVRQAIEVWLPSVALEEDRVLIYFAGEAFLSGGKAYLALRDADPARAANTAYPMEALSGVLSSRVKARWKAVFTDASHGGALTPETSNQAINQQLGSVQSGVLAITASRRQESAFEDPQLDGGHGLFTYYLVQGLRGQADRDHDGFVVADELIEYVRSRVRDHAQQRGARQTPTESGDFDPGFVLAFNPAAEAKQTAGALLVKTELDGVEVLLDGKSIGVIYQAKPFSIADLSPGLHTIQGVKGSARTAPQQVLVLPGKEVPVSLRF